jgi:hypothetical protein
VGDGSRQIFEPGRIIVAPSFRQTGAFLALMGTAYLYAVQREKKGAVCLANPSVVAPFLAAGWKPLAKPLGREKYGEPAHPLIVSTRGVPERYQDIFLAMQSANIIEIN